MAARHPRAGDPRLATRLRRELRGAVLFDDFSRGRYSTDASIYQIEPVGVVVPAGDADVAAALAIARDAGVAVLARGAGTSQCGQTVGEALVLDYSKHQNRLIELDRDAATAVVEPGMVLDELNRRLKRDGLMFPVDVSTASRATIGGMAGNNSCGTRSIVYGTMRDNVIGIDAWLADGTAAAFGLLDPSSVSGEAAGEVAVLIRALLALGRREADEIAARFPALMRRVGGYNIDALVPREHAPVNLAHLLVGSEGTLALSRRIRLRLHRIPAHKALGVCHFHTLYQAMDVTRDIVALGPSAVELVDRTMIDLARDIPLYRTTIERFVEGRPGALLLVEFAGDDRAAQLVGLRRLRELMADRGSDGAVVEAVDPGFQGAIWEVRKAALNIMMSMKGAGKPVSFIEDCAVRLEDLADYTDRLTQVFARHGTEGTWYAHASVGCLHVRPVLNLRDGTDLGKLRAIAEEAFAMVREYQGSHSGEHGDGLVRSEFHEAMFGRRVVVAFAEVKRLFDPHGLLNPGKIVDPPRMDDRRLFRYPEGYATREPATVLDWSGWGGFGPAVEMCNNNGACRKRAGGVMCPSFRVTGDERDLTRGRANSLRLALSGQLGDNAFTSADMHETLKLCVSCKACRRECPTGVDMARMKIEFLHNYRHRHPLDPGEKLAAFLPRYARAASRARGVLNLRETVPGLRGISQRWLGLSAKRPLPRWCAPFREPPTGVSPDSDRDVVLFVDTFSRYFEPGNARAAAAVLQAAGYRVQFATPARGSRPLCCGRTFLTAGLVEEARTEMRRLMEALRPHLDHGTPIIGLEPSCVLGFRDELPDLLGRDADRLASGTMLFEEFVVRERARDGFTLPLPAQPARQVMVHGHCHQKSFGVAGATVDALRLAPGFEVSLIESGCCGMAGAFGYRADTYAVSVAMARLDLIPAIDAADGNALIVAAGTSCRHQIRDLTGRDALHPARVLQYAHGGDS